MQRSLLAMLGDRTQAAPPEPPQPKKSRSIKLSSNTPAVVPPAAVVMPPLPPSDSNEAEQANVNKTSSYSKNIIGEDSDGDGHHLVSDTDLEDWACTLCTLINPGHLNICTACETERL